LRAISPGERLWRDCSLMDPRRASTSSPAGSSPSGTPLGRRNSQVGRRSSPLAGDDESQAAEKALHARKANLSRFESKLRDEVIARQASQARGLFAEGLAIPMLWEAMLSIFESMTRSIVVAAEELQQADTDVTRKQLKSQTMVAMMKVETARTAGAVQLSNQKAEMEASHHRMLEQKVAAMSSNEGALLAEAHAKQEELQKRLTAQEVASRAVEEKMFTMERLISSQEAKLTRLAGERDQLKEECDGAAALMVDALKEEVALKEDQESGALDGDVSPGEPLGASPLSRRASLSASGRRPSSSGSPKSPRRPSIVDKRREQNGQTVRDHATEMVGAYRCVSATCYELEGALAAGGAEKDARIQALETECEELRGTLIEAAAEAERAAMMHADECKRLTETLAERLKEDVERAARGEREAAEVRLNRLLGDMRVMGASMAEMEEDRLSLVAELDALRGDGQGTAAKLQATQTELAELREQMAQIQAELSQAMADLQIKTKENATLGEQVCRSIAVARAVDPAPVCTIAPAVARAPRALCTWCDRAGAAARQGA
jgi:chromosome segregation ATPase